MVSVFLFAVEATPKSVPSRKVLGKDLAKLHKSDVFMWTKSCTSRG